MKKEYLLGIIVAVAVLAVAAYFLWPKPNFQVSSLSLSATTVHPGDLVALNEYKKIHVSLLILKGLGETLKIAKEQSHNINVRIFG